MTTTNLQPGGFAQRRHWEHRARQLAWVSLAWHISEGVISIGLGVAASSVALVAFGADSFIEAAAGLIVIWRLTGSRVMTEHRERAEQRASRAIAVTFFLLAAYIVAQCTYALGTGQHPEASWRGIVMAFVTMIAMPPLAIAKQRIGRKIDSCATSSEGSQNMICAYLSAGLLVGLLANATLGWWWADPLVALGIAIVAVREGREAWNGKVDCC